MVGGKPPDPAHPPRPAPSIQLRARKRCMLFPSLRYATEHQVARLMGGAEMQGAVAPVTLARVHSDNPPRRPATRTERRGPRLTEPLTTMNEAYCRSSSTTFCDGPKTACESATAFCPLRRAALGPRGRTALLVHLIYSILA